MKLLTPVKNISATQGEKVVIIGQISGSGLDAVTMLGVQRKDRHYKFSPSWINKNLINNFSHKWDTSRTFPGEYSIVCRSTDSSCNYFAVAQGKVVIKPAKDCPAIKIVFPSTDITVERGGVINIVGEGSSSKGNAKTTIGFVRSVDGKGFYRVIKSDLPEDFTYEWNTSHLPPGIYRIHCKISGSKHSNYCYSGGAITIIASKKINK